MGLAWVLLVVLASLVVVIAVSYLAEALRPVPKPPETLAWAPDVPIQGVLVDGVTIRFIKSGAGPRVVLLHTLRTQLDLFERVVPDLAKDFTVYALDYRGMAFRTFQPRGMTRTSSFVRWRDFCKPLIFTT